MLLLFAIPVSHVGLGLVVHNGAKAQKIAYTQDVCTKLEQFQVPKRRRGSPTAERRYDLYLGNGEIYRFYAIYLEDLGITDARISGLEGTTVTVGYIPRHFLHQPYPLVALETAEGPLISEQAALENWNHSWEATHFVFQVFGTPAILLSLCTAIYHIVRSHKKKRRLRIKKEKRQAQLARKSQQNQM